MSASGSSWQIQNGMVALSSWQFENGVVALSLLTAACVSALLAFWVADRLLNRSRPSPTTAAATHTTHP